MSFINKHDILYPFQYGFRKHYSSSHTILDLTTTVYDAINEKKTCMLSHDRFEKSF